jgi:hypothetical protein
VSSIREFCAPCGFIKTVGVERADQVASLLNVEILSGAGA